MTAPPTLSLAVRQAAGLLTATSPEELACLSSSVLGGGCGRVRTFANLQVPADYDRLDPAAHLREVTAHLPGPTVGMMTAAPVARFQDVGHGSARVVATVGLGHPTAAAGTPPAARPPAPFAHGSVAGQPGTINLFIVLAVPLTGAGLAGALQTAVEAKTQALTAAQVPARNAGGPATGTASDAVAVACPVAFASCEAVAFAGPATGHGADLAQAVYHAVWLGILRAATGYAGGGSGGS